MSARGNYFWRRLNESSRDRRTRIQRWGFPLFCACYTTVFPLANALASLVRAGFTRQHVDPKLLLSDSLRWAVLGAGVAACYWLFELLERKLATQKARRS